MEGIVIHRAGSSDLMTIGEMAEIVFRHTYREILSSEQMEYMMEWMYSLSNLQIQMNEGHVFYIACIDGKSCGYLSIQQEGKDDDGITVFHLHKLYILPSYQGSGLGRHLFTRAVEHVRATVNDAPARIELNVNRNNPSQDFYKKMGMRILRQGDFDIGNGFYMNDYIMGLDIFNPHNKLEYPPMHTAEHILNSTMVKLFGCPRSRNAHIEKKKSKCDYILDSEPAPDQISFIEKRVNEVITSGLDVTIEYMDKEEASSIVDLEKLPDDASDLLRIVRIGDYDACACIGLHVSNTSEIGAFKILSHTYNEGIWRVRWKVTK